MPHYLLYTLLGFIGINGLALFSLISYYAFVHRAVHKKMASAQQLISSQQFSQRYQRLLRILLSNKARRVESLWRKLTPEEQGKLRLSEIPNRLRRLTKRGPKWLKMRAIHLLGLLQDQQSIGLLRQLSSENDMDLALASVAALGRYNDEANARFLMGLISNRYRINSSRVASVLEGMQLDLTTLLLETLGSPDHKCRFWAATLLARFASEQTRTALVKLIDHDDPNTRAAALDSLSKIGDQTCKAGIIHALADPVWYVRAHAALACGQVLIFESVPMLIEALTDPIWWVRHDAGRALEILLQHDQQNYVRESLLGSIDIEDAFARNMIAAILSNNSVVDDMLKNFRKLGQRADDARRLLVFIYDAGGAPTLRQDTDWQNFYNSSKKGLML